MDKEKPVRVEKPWGYELIFVQTDSYVGKLLFIKKGEALSLQYHRIKDETVILFSGSMEMLIEESDGSLRKWIMAKGDFQRIPPGRRHRMRAISDCEVFEVSTPHLDDVVRLEDRYGRVDKQG